MIVMNKNNLIKNTINYNHTIHHTYNTLNNNTNNDVIDDCNNNNIMNNDHMIK